MQSSSRKSSATSLAILRSLSASSSVTSKMRPGQVGALGRSSRRIWAIGSLTSADTGTLTASFTEAPSAAQSSKSRSAARMTRSVKTSISSFLGAGQEFRRRDDAAVGPPRAHQTFGTDQPLRAQIDFGLIPQLLPIAPQHLAQRDFAVVRARIGRWAALLRSVYAIPRTRRVALVTAEFAGRRATAPLMREITYESWFVRSKLLSGDF